MRTHKRRCLLRVRAFPDVPGGQATEGVAFLAVTCVPPLEGCVWNEGSAPLGIRELHSNPHSVPGTSRRVKKAI